MPTRVGVAVTPGSVQTLGGAEWIPTNIGGCVLWLRADLGITLNGADVSDWADQSGLGRDVSQATAAKQPAYHTAGGPNNNPYVEFALAEYLRGSWIQSQPIHTFAIVVPSSAGGTQQGVWDGSMLNSGRFSNDATVSQVDISAGGAVTLTPVDVTQWCRVEALYNGASSSLQINAASNTGNAGISNPDGLTIGVLGNEATWAGTPNVAEIVQFSAEVTGTNLTALRAYLNARYGL